MVRGWRNSRAHMRQYGNRPCCSGRRPHRHRFDVLRGSGPRRGGSRRRRRLRHRWHAGSRRCLECDARSSQADHRPHPGSRRRWWQWFGRRLRHRGGNGIGAFRLQRGSSGTGPGNHRHRVHPADESPRCGGTAAHRGTRQRRSCAAIGTHHRRRRRRCTRCDR